MRRRVRGAAETLAVQVADAVARMRDSDIQKPPGTQAIDWVAGLDPLGVEEPTPPVERTLGAVLKTATTRRWSARRGWSSPSRDDRAGVQRAHGAARPARARGRLSRRLRDQACPSPPSARRASRTRSSSSGPSRGGGCTGRPGAVLVSDPAQVRVFDWRSARCPRTRAVRPAGPGSRRAAPERPTRSRPRAHREDRVGAGALRASPHRVRRGGPRGGAATDGGERRGAAAREALRRARTRRAGASVPAMARLDIATPRCGRAAPSGSGAASAWRCGARCAAAAHGGRPDPAGVPVRRVSDADGDAGDILGSTEPYARAYRQSSPPRPGAGERRGIRVRHAPPA